MEKPENKTNRLGEIIIVMLVLVSAVLILAEITNNLVNELDAQDDQPFINETLTPEEDEGPIFPPGYTPEFNYDG